MPPQQAEPSQKNAVIAHTMLLGGSTVVALVLFLAGPMIEDLEVVGHALVGVSVIVHLVAWMLLRPRVAPRPATMSEADYWSDRERFGRATMLWAVAEGGTFLALVGWLFSGNISAMVVAAVGIGILVMYRPGVLTGR
ncbi:MAG: hypothetical protein KJZ47_08385 [Gemmatimonadales bacterium]|nr:hypothetical protein [Gemmatimonadales bacterium]